MLSESARMSSAAEVRFRVQASNSEPRAIKVFALDAHGDEVVRRLAAQRWTNATFFTTTPAPSRGGIREHGDGSGWLTDLSGQPRDVRREVDTADLVVMVAGPGGTAQVAPLIGQACSDKRVMTTALVVGATRASDDDALSRTLAQVRPWSLMVVIAEADDYIENMLIALRAA